MTYADANRDELRSAPASLAHCYNGRADDARRQSADSARPLKRRDDASLGSE
jgi:hypothetical protein